MNPYDFVRLDWSRVPERRQPVWHHTFVDREQKKLFSGSLNVEAIAETPIFLFDPRVASPDPKKPAQFLHRRGERSGDPVTYIIPGSSLKGLLRNVVETLGNGCFTLFDGTYEQKKVDYKRYVPAEFQHCEENTHLCIACRTFGMLKERKRGIFLGKVNISDAYSDAEEVYLYEAMHTAVLMNPKPHHQAFYLDEDSAHISGRKYYFHHSKEYPPLKENGPVRFGSTLANRYIQPLDYDTKFHFRIDFTNLEEDEFAALLLATVLEQDMRHKIGYGKPLGLGSIQFIPTRLTLIDYTKRYTQWGSQGGKTLLERDDLWQVYDETITNFSRTQLLQIAMEDLRRIWRWPAPPDVEYYYPSKRDWFDTEESIGKRIAQTKKTP